MSDRALVMAACVLAFLLVVSDSEYQRRRVVISSPDVYRAEWGQEDLSADLDDLDAQLDQLDVDEASDSVYLNHYETQQFRERERLRTRIRELRERARERFRAEGRAGFGEFRSAARMIRHDFRSFGREMRDQGREWRNQARELREQTRQLREEIRDSIREAIREKPSGRIQIELD